MAMSHQSLKDSSKAQRLQDYLNTKKIDFNQFSPKLPYILVFLNPPKEEMPQKKLFSEPCITIT